jgi:hypothetical protein
MANDINFEIKVNSKKAEKGVEKIEQGLKDASGEAKDIGKNLDKSATSGSKFGKLIKGLKFGAGLSAGKGVLDKVMGAFVENERVANLFNDSLGVITGTAETLVEFFSPMINEMTKAIHNPKEAWDDLVEAFENGVNWIYENLIKGAFDGIVSVINKVRIKILELRIAWNEYTGDTEEAAELTKDLNEILEDQIEIADRQTERYKKITGAVNTAIDSASKWGKKLKDNVTESVNSNTKLRDLTNSYIALDAEIEKNIQTLENQQAMNDQIANDETKSFAKRREAILQNLELKKEQIKLEQQLLQNQINLLVEENKAKGQSDERNAQIKALQIQMEGLNQTIVDTEISVKDTLRGIDQEAKDSERAIEDAVTERNRMVKEANTESIKLEHERIKAQMDAMEQLHNEEMRLLDERLASEEKGTARYNELLAEKITKEGEYQAERIAKEGEYAEAKKTYTEETTQMELDSLDAQAQAVSSALDLAGSLLGEDAKAQAVVSIAKAIMETYVGANKALASSPPPLNYVNMAGVIAGGLANVVQIRKQAQQMASELGTGGIPSGGGGAIPSGPNISIARGNVLDSNIQLNNALNQSMKPQRAYVVSTDIKTGESLDRKIYQNATLGG